MTALPMVRSAPRNTFERTFFTIVPLRLGALLVVSLWPLKYCRHIRRAPACTLGIGRASVRAQAITEGTGDRAGVAGLDGRVEITSPRPLRLWRTARGRSKQGHFGRIACGGGGHRRGTCTRSCVTRSTELRAKPSAMLSNMPRRKALRPPWHARARHADGRQADRLDCSDIRYGNRDHHSGGPRSDWRGK